MKSRILNKQVLIAGLVIIALGICIFVIYFLSRKDRFEDTPTTTFDISTAPTADNKNTTCSNSTDMISVCMNY